MCKLHSFSYESAIHVFLEFYKIQENLRKAPSSFNSSFVHFSEKIQSMLNLFELKSQKLMQHQYIKISNQQIKKIQDSQKSDQTADKSGIDSLWQNRQKPENASLKVNTLPNNFSYAQTDVPLGELQNKEDENVQLATAAKTDQVAKQVSKHWKSFSEDGLKPDFDFRKPEVDFSGINISPEEKKCIEEKAIAKFKEAMKIMDHSIADASLDMVGDKKVNSELLETLNKFTTRYLDTYKAYLEVLREEKQPFLPAEIGIAKSFGFSHKEIIAMIEPAQWYQKECDHFRKDIEKVGSSNLVADGFIHYLSQNNYRFSSLKELKEDSLATIDGTKCSQKDLSEQIRDPKIAEAVKDFCSSINNNKDEGSKIKSLGKKFGRFGGGIDAIERLKDKLATFDSSQTIDQQDFDVALLEELKGRVGEGEKEPGYISPELLLDVIEGRRDNEDPVSRMRHKLYFIYKSKGIANEIASSPEFVDKVNTKLAKKGWHLDKAICNYLHEQSPDSPIFKLGTYAAENSMGAIRQHAKPQEVQERFAASKKQTFGEAERIANKVSNLTKEELTTPYRYKMSPEEEITYLASAVGKGQASLLSKKIDKVAFDKLLETSKSNTPQPWIPGKYFFNLNDSSTTDSPYLKAVETLGLPQQAGISGSTDQTLTMAGMVGMTSEEEIRRLRMMYLGWMTSNDDHSVDEILTSTKSFGIPYTPSPDYYKQIYPEDSSFEVKVAAEQQRRGYELPDFYLSNDYVKQSLASLRKEKEEAQEKVVMDKLVNHNLFMKAVVAPPKAKEDDIFFKNSWNPFLSKLNTPKISAAVNDKIKFTYNPLTRSMEPHQKSVEPFYTGTKKTSVSLIPSHGKILPYKWNQDESVGLIFNREGSPFKDKYIFSGDALTDNKWWRRFYTKSEVEQPNFAKNLDLAVQEIESSYGMGKKKSFNHLRLNSMDELIARVDKVAKFGKHNEILASLKKDEVAGIFIFNKKVEENGTGAELYTRLKGIANKIALRDKEGVDVPLFMFDQARDKGLHLYSSEKQREDLQLLRANSQGEFDSVVAYLAAKSQLNEECVATALKNELSELEKNFSLAA